ncbi:sulfotransferase [Duganella sp. FT94W]|uniref:Sulfotransferase n=1 Tax=Duganella lactea TaxID=2692173 RepID=A0ABW9VD18_9BURK|nr:sulfotransferase [Duganella lactea]MYM37528.1 sulfotransferase [Duganella lactea]
MASAVHFISGLPRSGSTLLSALLQQNPRFSAAVTSPVASMWGSLQRKMSGGEFSTFFDDARRARVLRGVLDGYYAPSAEDGVVFDTNRTWTASMALTQLLYPGSRVICCVRDVGWIIDSVERMLQKNPLQYSKIFNFQAGSSVYARTEMLMNADNGLIGAAWSTLREAWFGEFAPRLIIVPYDNLVAAPEQVMRRLYREIDEPWFAHDFQHADYDEPRYDAALGMPGLHKVRPQVQAPDRKLSIPPDLFAKHVNASFWTKPELNFRNTTVL